MEYNGIPFNIYEFNPERSPIQVVFAERELFGVQFSVAGVSKPNELHQERNEDTILVDMNTLVFGVFDGVTGSPGSEAAGMIASASVADYFKDRPSVMEDREALETMQEALFQADSCITQYNVANQLETTTTAVVMRLYWAPNGEFRLIVGHAGDSRGLMYAPDRNNGELEQLTLDHALIPKWSFEKQNFYARVSSPTELTEEQQLEFSGRHNIRESLGRSKRTARSERSSIGTINIYDVTLDCTTILATDGVTDCLTYSDMEDALKYVPDDFETAKFIVDSAQERMEFESLSFEDKKTFRGKKDDRSIVIISMKEAKST